jgi:hypothetical protein
MSVSVTAGLLDLYAPKFGMGALGVPGLTEFGPGVDVVSIVRYSMKDFVEDVSRLVANDSLKENPNLDGRAERFGLWWTEAFSRPMFKACMCRQPKSSPSLNVRGRF